MNQHELFPMTHYKDIKPYKLKVSCLGGGGYDPNAARKRNYTLFRLKGIKANSNRLCCQGALKQWEWKALEWVCNRAIKRLGGKI